MGVSKERLLFLKWRNINYPLLKSEHSDSNFLWQAWQGRAAEIVEVEKPSHNKQMVVALWKQLWRDPCNVKMYANWLPLTYKRLNSALKAITKA